MHSIHGSFVPTEFVQLLLQHRRRLWTTAAVVAGAVALFALVRPNTWEASQALIIRNEAAARGAQERPGKFDRPEQMQTVQETIMELARSRSVLAATLAEVGSTKGEPSEDDIEELRKSVRLTPPKGAEFGKTEVFYLKVKDHDRSRSIQLADAMCRQLQSHYQQLLDRKAKSMTEELGRTVTLAEAELAAATRRLQAVEAEVGIDLSELRILEKSPSGISDLRTRLTTLENELREARTTHQAHEALRALLVASTSDAGHLLAAPNRLLDSQPALRRLKEGLIDSQLRTAQLRGIMSEVHPRVLGAVAAEEEVRRNLAKELDVAIRGVDVELKLTAHRIQSLQSQVENIGQRLDKLAVVRAKYSNLNDEIHHRQQNMQAAVTNLADARAARAAASSANLIATIDTPDTGSSPVGPGRLVTIVAGIFGGLAVGVGVILLSAPATSQPTRPTSVPSFERSGLINSTGALSLKQALARLAQRRALWN
jgi:uncharacterized protein involved in exopolysaccharide biosynthesis